MTTGTNHFSSLSSATRYYAAYGYDSDDVKAKVSSKEIFIGKPAVKAGERLLVDEDGRYHIRTA